MTVILVFLLVIFSIVGWWLAQQRLLSKPWLESGPVPAAAGTDRIGMSGPKIGLAVFLAVVGALFALFISAYFMRMEQSDWRSVPLPRILWLNTSLLVLSSVSLQCALIAARDSDSGAVKFGLVTAGLTAMGFLTGQLIAWQELTSGGYVVSSNPANGFFYLITGAHGLHIVGGLVALGRTTGAAWRDMPMDQLRSRIDLCALYWHFLLLVWLSVILVLLGWASEFVAMCSQLLT